MRLGIDAAAASAASSWPEMAPELFAQRPEALQDRLLADQVGREQSDDGLVLDPREAGRLVHPRDERFAALGGERVVRARPGAAGIEFVAPLEP